MLERTFSVLLTLPDDWNPDEDNLTTDEAMACVQDDIASFFRSFLQELRTFRDYTRMGTPALDFIEWTSELEENHA